MFLSTSLTYCDKNINANYPVYINELTKIKIAKTASHWWTLEVYFFKVT